MTGYILHFVMSDVFPSVENLKANFQAIKPLPTYVFSLEELERRNNKIAITLFWLSRIATNLPPFNEPGTPTEEVIIDNNTKMNI